MSTLVDDARAFLGHSLEDVQRMLGPDAEAVPGDEYGRMENVTSVEDPAVFPGTIYLKDDAVELVRVGRRELTDASRSELEAEFGAGAVPLRSRAGKQASLWVHAEQGVAYSAEGETLHFLEVFRPRTQQQYESEIYREPPAFIR